MSQPIHPHCSYLICHTHRSGSGLLCEAMHNTGLAGQPSDYFWRDYEPQWSRRWRTANYAEYLAQALACTTTPNGVFGAKISVPCLDHLVDQAGQLPGHAGRSPSALLATIFPNLRYIRLTRRDQVRQAVSWWKAVQTQTWVEEADTSPTPLRQPAFDLEEIDRWLGVLQSHETRWDQFFAEANVQPLVVVYEDFVAAYEATALEILRYLGVTPPADLDFGPRRLKKQADALSEEWVRRYYQLKENAG